MTKRNLWDLKETQWDWPEDWDHENGQYMRKCFCCHHDFIGHKRRSECKLCYEKNKMTSFFIVETRNMYAWTQKEMASIMDVHVITISKWESDTLIMSPQYQVRIRALRKVFEDHGPIGEKILALYEEKGLDGATHYYVKKAYGENAACMLLGRNKS